MDKKVYHSVRDEHTRPCLIQNSFQAFIYIKQSSVITFKNCQGKISHLYTREFATLYAKTLWLKYWIFKERVFKKYEYLSFLFLSIFGILTLFGQRERGSGDFSPSCLA